MKTRKEYDQKQNGHVVWKWHFILHPSPRDCHNFLFSLSLLLCYNFLLLKCPHYLLLLLSTHSNSLLISSTQFKWSHHFLIFMQYTTVAISWRLRQCLCQCQKKCTSKVPKSNSPMLVPGLLMTITDPGGTKKHFSFEHWRSFFFN